MNIILLVLIAFLIYYFTKTKENYISTKKDCSKETIDSEFYKYNTNIINRGVRSN